MQFEPFIHEANRTVHIGVGGEKVRAIEGDVGLTLFFCDVDLPQREALLRVVSGAGSTPRWGKGGGPHSSLATSCLTMASTTNRYGEPLTPVVVDLSGLPGVTHLLSASTTPTSPALSILTASCCASIVVVDLAKKNSMLPAFSANLHGVLHLIFVNGEIQMEKAFLKEMEEKGVREEGYVVHSVASVLGGGSRIVGAVYGAMRSSLTADALLARLATKPESRQRDSTSEATEDGSRIQFETTLLNAYRKSLSFGGKTDGITSHFIAELDVLKHISSKAKELQQREIFMGQKDGSAFHEFHALLATFRSVQRGMETIFSEAKSRGIAKMKQKGEEMALSLHTTLFAQDISNAVQYAERSLQFVSKFCAEIPIPPQYNVLPKLLHCLLLPNLIRCIETQKEDSPTINQTVFLARLCRIENLVESVGKGVICSQEDWGAVQTLLSASVAETTLLTEKLEQAVEDGRLWKNHANTLTALLSEMQGGPSIPLPDIAVRKVNELERQLVEEAAKRSELQSHLLRLRGEANHSIEVSSSGKNLTSFFSALSSEVEEMKRMLEIEEKEEASKAGMVQIEAVFAEGVEEEENNIDYETARKTAELSDTVEELRTKLAFSVRSGANASQSLELAKHAQNKSETERAAFEAEHNKICTAHLAARSLLQSNLDSLTKKYQLLEEKQHSTLTEKSRLERLLLDLQGKNSTANTEFQVIQTKLNSSEERFAVLSRRHNELKLASAEEGREGEMAVKRLEAGLREQEEKTAEMRQTHRDLSLNNNKLTMEHSALSAKCQTLREELEAKETTITSLRSESTTTRSRLAEEIRELKSELTELSKSSLETSLDTTQENSRLRQEVERRSGENSQLQMETASLKTLSERLQTQLQELKIEAIARKTENDKLKSAVTTAQNNGTMRASTLEAEMAKRDEELHETIQILKHNDELHLQDITKMKEVVDTQNEAASAMRVKMALLEKDSELLASLKEELRAAQVSRHEAAGEGVHHRSRIADLSTQLSSAETQVGLQNAVASRMQRASEEKAAILASQNASLQALLPPLQEAQRSALRQETLLKGEIQDLERELSQMQMQNTSLEREVKGLKEAMGVVKEERTDLEMAVVRLQEQCAQVRRREDAAGLDLAELQTQLKKAEERCTELSVSLEAKHGLVRTLESQLVEEKRRARQTKLHHIGGGGGSGGGGAGAGVVKPALSSSVPPPRPAPRARKAPRQSVVFLETQPEGGGG